MPKSGLVALISKGNLMWVLRTIGLLVAQLITAISIAFFIIHSMPGNPFEITLSNLLRSGVPYQQAVYLAEIMTGYNPNVNIVVSYFQYLWNILHGNLGYSMIYKSPSIVLIAAAAPWTILIVVVSLTLAFVFGYLLGLISASKRGKLDVAINVTSVVFNSIPSYMLALILLIVFGVYIRVLPVAGLYDRGLTPGLNLPFILSLLKHLTLPILTYFLILFPGWAFGTRNLALNITKEDYVLTARARGLPERRVLTSYIGKNVLLPQLTALLFSYGLLFGNSIFIESMFAIPGLGYLLYSAAGARDYVLTVSTFLIIIIAVILGNFIADVTYG
ncbi:ABC transporter permease, partial [Caldivirga sp.]|uniref:ABC transporter permease n=1 Tax=Caldivirga sp. TaxID=2080243 RepID=UPI0025BB8575